MMYIEVLEEMFRKYQMGNIFNQYRLEILIVLENGSEVFDKISYQIFENAFLPYADIKLFHTKGYFSRVIRDYVYSFTDETGLIIELKLRARIY
jgi:hypothetical protein